MRVIHRLAFVFQVRINLALYGLIRYWNLCLLDQLVHNLVARLKNLLANKVLLELLLDVARELRNGVKLAGHLSKCVICLRKFALLDGIQGDGYLGFATGLFATN